MFSITFTKDQAEQFIHGIFQKNFRDNPEFIVRISDEECDMEIKKYIKEFSSGSQLKADAKDGAEINPWLTPDEEDWFTHDPDWKSEECPDYIRSDKKVFVLMRDEFLIYGHVVDYAKFWNWSVDGGSSDIIKWKYV